MTLQILQLAQQPEQSGSSNYSIMCILVLQDDLIKKALRKLAEQALRNEIDVTHA